MVKPCNYPSPDVEERLVRDRFLVGLLDHKLSDKLCQNPKMTLHEAPTYVRQHEDAGNERRAHNSVEASSFAVDAACLRKGKQAPADKTTQQLCPFCGRASHPRVDCSARSVSCNFCRKSSHFEKVCREKKRVNGKHTRKPLASSIELHAVAGERPNAKFVEVLVDGHPLSFKVDYGAKVSVVPSTFSGVPSKLQDPKRELKDPSNNILES
ncbi:uncharacterized protein LOC119377867 [Rhipicephalus sanguineus]|uniref:uncharacterized protein LOC119377867 n=1 Tax=Rhipicephalus sanguineus TaxID=34632 RepID=UPI001894FFDA|nr:uncharacterized protein LOC119377867 [Rhipicephalus sanguineus]